MLDDTSYPPLIVIERLGRSENRSKTGLGNRVVEIGLHVLVGISDRQLFLRSRWAGTQSRTTSTTRGATAFVVSDSMLLNAKQHDFGPKTSFVISEGYLGSSQPVFYELPVG
jgi:hypothetical protein